MIIKLLLKKYSIYIGIIIRYNENYSLGAATIQLKSDIESKTEMFMMESYNLVVDCGINVGDATLRYKIGACSGLGVAIVVSLALNDLKYHLNEMGVSTLQCYNLATISNALSSKINRQFSNLDVHTIATGYYGEPIGEYII